MTPINGRNDRIAQERMPGKVIKRKTGPVGQVLLYNYYISSTILNRMGFADGFNPDAMGPFSSSHSSIIFPSCAMTCGYHENLISGHPNVSRVG